MFYKFIIGTGSYIRFNLVKSGTRDKLAGWRGLNKRRFQKGWKDKKLVVAIIV